ncbi:S8 family serine peptidase [Streptomyces sp. NBC_00654]|uniref:S8 family serine peptidase n=1 Tax=Streptomyces sp. NBC_00654 TaxID=2975799 RepID=UPI00224F3BA6|nr:S8 family serine peptidase [Streptomyces sp. NBC_00654]MCX4967447.1 S8 family serine peptidase [Streptomyces sp. NBC_00654]
MSGRADSEGAPDRQYRIAVYFDTDPEAERIEAIVGDRAHRYQGVVLAETSGERIARLRAAGRIVDVRADLTAEHAARNESTATDAPPGSDGPQSMLPPCGAGASGTTDRAAPDPEFVADLTERAVDAYAQDAAGTEGAVPLAVPSGEPDHNTFLVRLRGPLDRTRRAVLSGIGAHVVQFQPPGTYRLRLTPGQRDLVAGLPWVTAVRPWGLADTVTPALDDALAPAAPGAAGPRLLADEGVAAPDPYLDTFDVLVHDALDLATLRPVLEATPGVEVLAAVDVMLRFRTDLTGDRRRDLLAVVAARDETRQVSPYRPPLLYADHARRLVGVDRVGPRADVAEPPAQVPWTGTGEIVGVFDSGVDGTHPDLVDRIVVNESLVGGEAFDFCGHGTHVAGIVVGSGAASGGLITGVAPGARLAVFRVFDEDNRLHVGPSLGPMLTRAVDAGAHIINLSWGNPLSGTYDQYSLAVDSFVAEHPDVLVIVAAGNSGVAPKGTHEFNTCGTPATAKNALTVGACTTDRDNDGLADLTWNRFRQPQFPLPPAGGEHVCGNPDLPAAISSRGPSDYGSVVPHLLAPGTFVLSARSSSARMDPRLPWRDSPDHDGHYMYIGGTSMAAPVVAGAAAVLRQYLREVRRLTSPSAALMKAVLIAATRRLPSLRTPHTAQDLGYPDFDQGFGRLDLAIVLPTPDAPADRRLVWADLSDADPGALEAFADPEGTRRGSHTYRLTVPDGPHTDDLRVVLAWTDRPGNAVQNNLDLAVTTPDGTIHAGNEEHTYNKVPGFDRNAVAQLTGLPLDRANTVEAVRIGNPAPGTYSIKVFAQNTPFPAQGYAVCAAGPISEEELTTP